MGEATEQTHGTPAGSDHPEAQARREFIKKIGWAGATVPAVSLLLAANLAHAAAGETSASGGSGSS